MALLPYSIVLASLVFQSWGKGGGLYPQNLSRFTFQTFRYFLCAMPGQGEFVSRQWAVPYIMFSSMPENVTTCCGKFRNKLIVLHKLKDRFVKTMQI